MSAYTVSCENNILKVGNTGDFSVFRTFDCGQCFRFEPVPNSPYKCEFSGVAAGRKVSFAQNEPGEIFIISDKKADAADFGLWARYLSLDTDYDLINDAILENIPRGADREITKKAIDASRGIRILRQDRWEALCSFIVSQNNNIPRIKKIISSLCEKYGEDIGGAYDFPSAESLFAAGEDAIFSLRTGFRAKYIYDAARAVSGDSDFLEKVARCENYADAEHILTSVKGVGPKVAACTLLFGFSRLDAFPVDVWIKRVMEKRYSPNFDFRLFGKNAGVAQQYLFYFERYLGGGQAE